MWLTKAHTSQEAPTPISGSSSLNALSKFKLNLGNRSSLYNTNKQNINIKRFTRILEKATPLTWNFGIKYKSPIIMNTVFSKQDR